MCFPAIRRRAPTSRDCLRSLPSPLHSPGMGSNQRLAMSLSVAALAAQPAFAESGGRLSVDQFSLLAERLHESRSFKVRLQAALLLGVAGGPDAEPLLVTAMQRDKDAPVRAAAALALGETQDERAFEPLVAALGDDDTFFRAQVEKGLAELAQSTSDGSMKLWAHLSRVPEVAQERGIAVLGSLGAGGVVGLCAAATLDRQRCDQGGGEGGAGEVARRPAGCGFASGASPQGRRVLAAGGGDAGRPRHRQVVAGTR